MQENLHSILLENLSIRAQKRLSHFVTNCDLDQLKKKNNAKEKGSRIEWTLENQISS